MIWLWLIMGAFVLCFTAVLLFGAPYLPTLRPQLNTALQLADLRPGQTLLELGCGDGKVLIAAAERGAVAIGYELNPLLVVIAWLRTRRYGGRVRVVWGNFWTAAWPPADVVFTFLLPRYMAKLDTQCKRYGHKPVKLVSFAFEIPGKRPARRENGVFLYRYN